MGKIQFRYTEGDSVRIVGKEKLRLLQNTKEWNPGFVSDMYNYCGKETTIEMLYGNSGEYYSLEGIPFWWSPVWIEPIDPVPENVFQTFDELLEVVT